MKSDQNQKRFYDSVSSTATGMGVIDYMLGKTFPLYGAAIKFSPVRSAANLAAIAVGSQGEPSDRVVAAASFACLAGQFTKMFARSAPVVGNALLARDVYLAASNLIDARAERGCIGSIYIRNYQRSVHTGIANASNASMTALALGAKKSVDAPFHERLAILEQ